MKPTKEELIKIFESAYEARKRVSKMSAEQTLALEKSARKR